MATKNYFRIDKDSKIAIMHNEWADSRITAIKAARKYCTDELGAVKHRIYDTAQIHSVILEDGKEAPEGMRNKAGFDNNEFFPNGRTKIGKAIAKMFNSFMIDEDRSPELINHPRFFASSGRGMCMYSPKVWRSDKDNVVAVIYTNKDYQFTPPSEFTEMLPSEFQKLQEA